MNAVGTTVGGLAVGLAVIAACTVVSRVSAFYRGELAAESARRELPLDGLRGIAALMVVMHHAAIFRNSLRTGQWGDANSPVLQAFGPGGVHFFFMLTGYLFWSKARAAHGKLKIAKLWRGRVYRIAPLYLFSVALIMAIALGMGKVHVTDAGFFKSAWRLLGLGLIPWRGFGGFDVGNINAGVVWTLRYEWCFYLALPFIAWLAVKRRVFWFGVVAYVAVFFGMLWLNISLQPGLIFFLGMLCPVLLDNETVRAQLRSPVAAAMFPVFLVTVAGNTFWGLLVRPAFRCLGAISYSLYLLHGILFYVIITALKSAGLTALPEIAYWVILAVTAVGSSAFCSLTYRWVEFPFLSRSHKPASGAAGSAPIPEIAQSAP